MSSLLEQLCAVWHGFPKNLCISEFSNASCRHLYENSSFPPIPPPPRLTKEEKLEESRCNYESYRVLVQNAFHGVTEVDALARINVDEMYPEPSKKAGKKSK